MTVSLSVFASYQSELDLSTPLGSLHVTGSNGLIGLEMVKHFHESDRDKLDGWIP
jgi:hypothetical protein